MQLKLVKIWTCPPFLEGVTAKKRSGFTLQSVIASGARQSVEHIAK